VWPLIVLTKLDCATQPRGAIDELRHRIPATVPIEAVDATAAAAAATLAPYLAAGQTAVLLGSSGAGKSTLTNTLLGRPAQAIGAVRADDSRGRHTTTARTLHRLPGGACLIDTPGCAACASTSTRPTWRRASATSRGWRNSAASATAGTSTSPAARCARAWPPTGCATSTS